MPAGGSAVPGRSARPTQTSHPPMSAARNSAATHRLLCALTDLFDLLGRDGISPILPAVADKCQYIGHLLIRKRQLRHQIIVGSAIDRNRSGETPQRNADAAVFISHQEIRLGQRWKDPWQAFAVKLMAHRAVLHEDKLALLHLQFFGHGYDGGCLPDG